jgi:hypothetical protein
MKKSRMKMDFTLTERGARSCAANSPQSHWGKICAKIIEICTELTLLQA